MTLPSTRLSVSVDPPGAAGTTSLIVLAGKIGVCAPAIENHATADYSSIEAKIFRIMGVLWVRE